jgi:hypothetical protein
MIALDYSAGNMTPPKFGTPWKYVRVTQQGQRRKERLEEPENVVELEDVTTSETESLSPTRVEEETSIVAQGEMGQSSTNPNETQNPNPETHAKPEEMKGQQQGHDEEEVLVKDITNQPKIEGEEDTTETMVEGQPGFRLEKKGAGRHRNHTPLHPRCSGHSGGHAQKSA